MYSEILSMLFMLSNMLKSMHASSCIFYNLFYTKSNTVFACIVSTYAPRSNEGEGNNDNSAPIRRDHKKKSLLQQISRLNMVGVDRDRKKKFLLHLLPKSQIQNFYK
jgi:hypothetical protein